MIENVLIKKKISSRGKIAVKSLIAFGILVLAVVLPQIVHAAVGPSGGAKWLPMYLPVLLGGCLLGWSWGIRIGVLSPLVSFLITLAIGNPMPAAERLPFMMIELAVFAVVSGLFANKIAKNAWMAFPAVLLAQISGRAAFMLLTLIFQSFVSFTPASVWSQIQTGLSGMIVQALVVPAIVMGLKRLLDRENEDRLADRKKQSRRAYALSLQRRRMPFQRPEGNRPDDGVDRRRGKSGRLFRGGSRRRQGGGHAVCKKRNRNGLRRYAFRKRKSVFGSAGHSLLLQDADQKNPQPRGYRRLSDGKSGSECRNGGRRIRNLKTTMASDERSAVNRSFFRMAFCVFYPFPGWSESLFLMKLLLFTAEKIPYSTS